MIDKVAIVRIGDDGYSSAIEKAFTLLDFSQDCFLDKSIAIKPNLCNLTNPSLGETTNVKVVEALIKMIQKPRRVVIVESDHWVASAEEEYKRLGYVEMAERNNIRLMNISKSPSYTIISKNGKHFTRIKVPRELLEYDFFISVPILKMHPDCCITSALKNQFGMNPEKFKSKHHAYLSQALYDLNRLYSPNLVVVDGNFVRVSENRSKRIGLIVVGQNPVAVDHVVAKLFGFHPMDVPYLKYFQKHGKPLNLEIVGEQIENCIIKTHFKGQQRPTRLRRLSNLLYRISDGFTKLERSGKDLSLLLRRADIYLSGTPPSQLIPAVYKGYKTWRKENTDSAV